MSLDNPVSNDPAPENNTILFELPIGDPIAKLTAKVEQINTIIANDPNSDLADKLEDVAAGFATAIEELEKTPPDTEAAAGAIEGATGDLEAAIDDDLFADDTGTELATCSVGVARRCDSGRRVRRSTTSTPDTHETPRPPTVPRTPPP